MGLIKAILGSAGGTLADQWKEYFYCEAIDKDIIAVKGQKKCPDVHQISTEMTILSQTEVL